MVARSLPLALCLFWLVACSPEQLPADNAPPRAVQLTHITSDSGSQIRRFAGVVEATQSAQLAFRVSGEIKQLPFRPGQRVAQGDVIAALDATDYELAREQAAAQEEVARTHHQRVQALSERNLISPAQLEQAEADLRMARAALARAETNLAYTVLEAPFDGVVATLNVEQHENVAPQQPILTLQADGLVDISIQVPERLFLRVRHDRNYQPDILFDGLPGELHKASLRQWDRIADAATNTYRVVFTLPAPESINVLPGMTATVIIDASAVLRTSEPTLSVPASAVFMPTDKVISEGTAYVWLYRDDGTKTDVGTVHLRQVEISSITQGGVMVINGLSEGDRIVQAGVHQLKDGQQVRPWVRERGL